MTKQIKKVAFVHNREVYKVDFNAGGQFNCCDCFWHKDDKLPVASIEELVKALSEKLDIETLPKRIEEATQELQSEIENLNKKIDKTPGRGSKFDIEITEDDGKITIIQACGEILLEEEQPLPYYNDCSTDFGFFMIGDLEL